MAQLAEVARAVRDLIADIGLTTFPLTSGSKGLHLYTPLDEPVSSRVENGPVLRYTRDSRGKETVMADPRVPLLRERLGLAAEPNSNYNAALAMALRRGDES